jgi:DNA-binding transcriptional LysR family regulator
MERLIRISRLWNWLPAFRVVAETQHLPTAARTIGVSAPALSRAIKLVESDLGVQLFKRQGGRLVLSSRGKHLLSSVRDAMRRVDDGISGATSSEPRGPLVLGLASGSAAQHVTGALVRLQAKHPHVCPTLIGVAKAEIASHLLDGSIDAALTEELPSSSEIEAKRVAHIAHHVYCGRHHPLFRVRRPTRKQLLEADWVAPLPPGQDAWPVESPRRVTAWVSLLSTGVELCEDGSWLAAFPESVEARSGPRLKRIESPIVLPDAVLYLAYRRAISPDSAVTCLLDELRQELAAC